MYRSQVWLSHLLRSAILYSDYFLGPQMCVNLQPSRSRNDVEVFRRHGVLHSIKRAPGDKWVFVVGHPNWTRGDSFVLGQNRLLRQCARTHNHTQTPGYVPTASRNIQEAIACVRAMMLQNLDMLEQGDVVWAADVPYNYLLHGIFPTFILIRCMLRLVIYV